MRYAIGVDLGGTSLRVAAVDEKGRILERTASPTRTVAGREAVIDSLCDAVKGINENRTPGDALAGIGVGVPGIIYMGTGMVRQSPNLPGWENFPVRNEIEERLGTRVILDNDANAAALGEKWLGAGRDVDSLCMITLGTGVGGGLIFEDRIWHGFLGMAGEIGHMTVSENGIRCGCGNSGCLETEASASAVIRGAGSVLAARRSKPLEDALGAGEPLTARLVHQFAQQGDAACREIFASVGRYLGQAIASLVNTLDLPLYVIGGGVADGWDQFSPAMFEELRKRSYVFLEGRTRVEPSRLQGDAGLLGAARLGFQDAL